MNFACRLIASAAVLPLLFSCAQSRPETVATAGSTVVLHDENDVHAVRAAYLERLRLGLGSPFRLMEIVAHDARLSTELRARLIRELFERTESGETYQAVHTLPAAHQRIIEHAVMSARDARIGELAVNLAYDSAVAEQVVSAELQYAAAATAALLRDRVLARQDVQRLRAYARAQDVDPHTLLAQWRAQRLLLVEQPQQLTMNQSAQEAAARLAALFMGGVRQAARQPNRAAHAEFDSELTGDAAQRILALPRVFPQQSAIVIAMRAAQLPYRAHDEEALVAELALGRADANLAAQRAAIALRPFAQQPVWHAQSVAPSAADLLVRHGVQVVFLDDVQPQWQPYHRAQLARALSDLQLVLPGLSLKGLTIEVGAVDSTANHIAFHDPRKRSVRWSPAAGAGSLAHEIGHDVDWQIARRAYGRKARYASDDAADVNAMMELTRPGAAPSERKTEIFARQFEWLIAAGLAELGRMNGTLTSVQHKWLPGHGAGVPPNATLASAKAIAGTIARSGPVTNEAKERIERIVLAPASPAPSLTSVSPWQVMTTCGLRWTMLICD